MIGSSLGSARLLRGLSCMLAVCLGLLSLGLVLRSVSVLILLLRLGVLIYPPFMTGMRNHFSGNLLWIKEALVTQGGVETLKQEATRLGDGVLLDLALEADEYADHDPSE